MRTCTCRFALIPRRDLNLLSFFPAIVSPSKPVVRVTEPFNSVSWDLTEGSEDERPDSFTVNLYFAHNRSLAQQISGVAADVRRASLSVVPGMNYSVTVIAHNQDGTTLSDSHQFSTPPGRKRRVQSIILLCKHICQGIACCPFVSAIYPLRGSHLV